MLSVLQTYVWACYLAWRWFKYLDFLWLMWSFSLLTSASLVLAVLTGLACFTSWTLTIGSTWFGTVYLSGSSLFLMLFWCCCLSLPFSVFLSFRCLPWQSILAEGDICASQRRASSEGLGLLARLGNDVFTARLVGSICIFHNLLVLGQLSDLHLLASCN